MRRFNEILGVLLAIFTMMTIVPATAQDDLTQPEDHQQAQRLTLIEAAMCEFIKNFRPHNPAIAFSTEMGSVSCFSEFDPVPERTIIYHNWYNRDTLVTVKKLTLNPPKWSSFSSIQLRESDKGPWRVEIVTESGDILKVLRFSITE
jgi:hypothetical protein